LAGDSASLKPFVIDDESLRFSRHRAHSALSPSCRFLVLFLCGARHSMLRPLVGDRAPVVHAAGNSESLNGLAANDPIASGRVSEAQGWRSMIPEPGEGSKGVRRIRSRKSQYSHDIDPIFLNVILLCVALIDILIRRKGSADVRWFSLFRSCGLPSNW
jgi:hypothetical protein